MGRSVDADIYYGIDISNVKIPDAAYEAIGEDPPWCGPDDFIDALDLPVHYASYGREFEGTVIYTQSINAWGGGATPFSLEDLVVGPEDDEKLRAFCEVARIDPIKPTWLLCPSYS